jgi:hypothetical protein
MLGNCVIRLSTTFLLLFACRKYLHVLGLSENCSFGFPFIYTIIFISNIVLNSVADRMLIRIFGSEREEVIEERGTLRN